MAPLEWSALLGWIAVATAGGLVIFHAVAGFYHVKYYVRRRDEPETWKCQARRKLPAKFQRKAVLLSSFNLTVAGVLTGVLIDAIARGLPTPIYMDVAEWGWPYTIGSTVLLFILLDAIAFYIHWALHLKFLYKRFHRAHHQYVATTPYVTVAIHPVVFVSLQVATAIPLFIIPFHVVSIGAVLVYILVFNIIDHSGVSLDSRIPWQASSNYHDDHHAHFHVNFGQHLVWWDRLHGTLRRKDTSYGVELFGGRGVSSKDGDGKPEYLDYVQRRSA